MNFEIVDVDTFKRETGVGDSVLKELYESFINEMTKTKTELQEYIIREDWKQIKKVIHDIKGVSSNFKIKKMTDCTKEIEGSFKDLDKTNETLIDKLTELIRLIDSTLKELYEFISQC